MTLKLIDEETFVANQKKQVLAHEAKLLEAIRSNDPTRLDGLLHDDLLFNIPSGQTCTKDMDLEAYRSKSMVVHSVSASDMNINIIGDTAVVSVKIDLKASYYDQAIDDRLSYLRVWKLFGTHWKVIAGSCTPYRV